MAGDIRKLLSMWRTDRHVMTKPGLMTDLKDAGDEIEHLGNGAELLHEFYQSAAKHAVTPQLWARIEQWCVKDISRED